MKIRHCLVSTIRRIQVYQSSCKHNGQVDQCLTAAPTPPDYEAAIIQRSCGLCCLVRRWNVDSATIWQKEAWGISYYVMSASHCRSSLIYLVPNTVIAQLTGQDSLLSSIHSRRLAIFGHIRRLLETTPADTALKLVIDAHSGRTSDNVTPWRWPRGRPLHIWMWQLEEDTGLIADNLWSVLSVILKLGGR